MRVYRSASILKHDGMRWEKGEVVEAERLQGVLHGLLASGAIVAEDVPDPESPASPEPAASEPAASEPATEEPPEAEAAPRGSWRRRGR